jgi:hypothetical protein
MILILALEAIFFIETGTILASFVKNNSTPTTIRRQLIPLNNFYW